MKCHVESPNGSLVSRSIWEFFRSCHELHTYELLPEPLIDKDRVAAAFEFDSKVSMEFRPYAEILPSFRPTKRDSSVRAGLVDLKIISDRYVDIFPGIFTSHSSVDVWSRICCKMQKDFLANDVFCGPDSQMAYYWYDAVKIFANYLDLVFAHKRGKPVAPLLQRCEKVAHDVLPQAVPIGWLPIIGSHKFLFVCG